MPLSAKALGQALHEDLTLHSTLCRREAGAFQRHSELATTCRGLHPGKAPVSELAEQTESAVSVIRFVNIRETGGWSRDAARPRPRSRPCWRPRDCPTPSRCPRSLQERRALLIIGALDAAERAAALLSDVLDVTIFTQGPAAPAARRRGVSGAGRAHHRPERAGWARSTCAGRRQPD
jgi:hypothetical protein